MEANMNGKTALVLGATGGIGGEMAWRLLAGGWRVRALTRTVEAADRLPGIDCRVGDAMVRGDVVEAAQGAAVIVHAVNPPGYRNWGQLVLPMIDNTLAAARTHGARVVLPGTVYNYGPDAFPLIAEDAPQSPTTRKGAIRVELERRLEAAARAGEARTLIVRAGDFFGPRAANNWFSQGIVAPGARPKAIQDPNSPGVGHQWAYLPDVAETMVQLIERDDLEDFARFHMAGHWDPDGTAMIAAVVRALGAPTVRVKPLPWAVLRLVALFAETPRELMEMRYLWKQPVRLDGAKLAARLGREPRTPLDGAVRETLMGMGCL
jgi:nucleoside-diphosphate-sugar epimerase